MRSLRPSALAWFVVAASLLVALPALAQDTGSRADRPFVFFTPGLAIWNRDTSHDSFFDSIGSTLVLPFSPHASAVTTFDLQFQDKPRWSAAANYDWFVAPKVTLRLSGGLIDDQVGARLTAFHPMKRFGTGVRLGVEGGELEAGAFLSTPYTWGFALRKESMGDRMKHGSDVADLGAATAVAFSFRGGMPGLGTEPLYFYPRDRDWPRLGQGPQGAAATTAELPAKLYKTWAVGTGGPVRSSAAIEEKTVYVGSDDGYLYALNLATGATQWHYRLGAPVASSPAVADGRVYVGCDDGAVYCLSTSADKRLPGHAVGNQLWSYRTGGPVTGCPLVTVSGLALVGSRDGTLYALAAATGRLAWSYKTDGPITASPVRSAGQIPVVMANEPKPTRKDVVFCASEDGNLYALTEREGTLVWRVATGSPISSTPAVAPEAVYVANQAGHVLALNPATGEQRWTQTVRGDVRGSLTLADRRVIVPQRSGELTGLDAATGAAVWQAAVPADIVGTPAVAADRTLFVGSTNGRLYSLDLRSGKPVWDFQTQGPITASPAIAHGMLVCGSQDGAVYGLADHAPPALASGATAPPTQPTAAGAPAPLTPAKPAWTPPPGWSEPPATAAEDTSPTATTPASPALEMRLVSEPSEASELPVQLTDSRRTTVAWGTLEPSAEVDGQVVRNENGQIRVDRSFASDGTYPVVMVIGKGTAQELTQCRLVIVDTGEEPSATRDVAFSPNGDGVGDTIAFRLFATGLEAHRVTDRTLDLHSQTGGIVRSWSAAGPGESTFIWDGRDLAGKALPAGRYVAVYAARDETGKVQQMRQTVLLVRPTAQLLAQ